MDKSDSGQRGMYFPMKALPMDLVSRYGDVRILVVPKERTSSTSSCKENEDCFSKVDGNVFDEDSLVPEGVSRTIPVSPDFSCRQRQVFDYRTNDGPSDQDRFTQERQDSEIIKAKSETTPKRGSQATLRFENSTEPKAPHKSQETDRLAADRLGADRLGADRLGADRLGADRLGAENMSDNTRRQLFSGIENEYRVIRNDAYPRKHVDSHEDIYVERHRESELHPAYLPCVDKRSPTSEHSRAVFDWDFPYHDRPLTSPSWSAQTHHRCECMERQQRHIDSCRNRTDTPQKRKFGDICSLENTVPMSPRLKRLKCTCSMMETNFLQMAEAAYKNIRRKDTSPSSFEQFNRELVQTNSVLKDSVSILSTIREMCEHKNCIRS